MIILSAVLQIMRVRESELLTGACHAGRGPGKTQWLQRFTKWTLGMVRHSHYR